MLIPAARGKDHDGPNHGFPPLRVVTDAAVNPYIRLPFSQLDELKRELDSHGIRYRVRENIVSLEGGPYMAVLYLDRGTNAQTVQAILDGVR